MSISKHLNITLIPLLIFITVTLLTPISNSTLDYTAVVYKGCSRQPLSDPANALSSLTSTLIQQSSRYKFYKTTIGGSGSGTISGLYQCRGDLNNADCYNCVSKLPQIITNLCGKVAAARIQLLGCYMLYELNGFTQMSGLQMVYKVCSQTNVAGSGFEMRRDTALQVMQNGIASNGNGYYGSTYQGVYVMGQCDGDLGPGDCGLCVKSAVEKAQVECGSSLSGEVYLHKCFIGYGYFPNGVPTSNSGFSSSDSGHNPGKTIAIIFGGAAGIGFLVIMALFLKRLKKKDDDY